MEALSFLGRFLAPAPFFQAPDFTQAFNRYSYALNNPLKYQDEREIAVIDSFILGRRIRKITAVRSDFEEEKMRIRAKRTDFFVFLSCMPANV